MAATLISGREGTRPSRRALRQPANIHGDRPLILDHGRP